MSQQHAQLDKKPTTADYHSKMSRQGIAVNEIVFTLLINVIPSDLSVKWARMSQQNVQLYGNNLQLQTTTAKCVDSDTVCLLTMYINSLCTHS